MAPDMAHMGVEANARYEGPVLDADGAVFEFSKEGPELRLFFSGISEALVRSVEQDDCYLGLMRSDDLDVVLWRIGDKLAGDAQFHVYLYFPENRPLPQMLTPDARYAVQITLIDRSSKIVRAVRTVTLSRALSRLFDDALNYQLGNPIQREAYEAQVSMYQSRYPHISEAIEAAQIFEKVWG